MQKAVKDVIHKLALKYNLPDYVIEKICYSQFTFVRDVIRKGEFETVMLHKWGKFTPSLRKLKWKEYHRLNKEQKDYDNTESTGDSI